MNTSQHRPAQKGVRAWALVLVPAIAVLLAWIGIAQPSAQPARAASLHVDVVNLNSEINPSTARFLQQAIATAASDGSQALVIVIDTPGGDLDSMKQITQAELTSTVPIITYVYPPGARAASAGAFVALSAPLAAMAPTTRIGASSPVSSTGSNLDSTLLKKIESDLVAQITGTQNRYGRNATLAARMVTDAASYDDQTALREHIVDLGARSLPELLQSADGHRITLSPGHSVVLHTAGAALTTLSPGLFDALYSFLLDPNVVFLLFIVALIGIYLEISHPGAIVPGVVGGIALILFLLGAGSLSPNWTGLLLMGLALILLVLDIRLPSHGILTVGAVISLVVGSLLFFNSDQVEHGPGVNPWIVYLMAAVVGLLSLLLVSIVVRAQRQRRPSGIESMIGSRAVTITPLTPSGRVKYCGEDWAASLVEPYSSLDEGCEVTIVAVEGLRLYVRPSQSPALSADHRSTIPPSEKEDSQWETLSL
ncbi:NfeD family protein [Thermogemmatispora sp.]|uniref:NfeD family protein n=1 Tax=Thermogemmatispora sp. TaxID=1968838 RepID=UPI001D4B9E45|nr:nodulation protein NfeD [Thermogemmatispora sp.]MBX5451164.1 nodulation protein NfeD [Thermogemmatispora sp.]